MVSRDPRLSHQTLKVLRQFLEHPREKISGSDISRQSGLLSGTIYPILLRLERAGWLDSKWEQLDPHEAGRPRKRLYFLTGVGYNKSRAALEELGVTGRRLAWTS